MTEDDRSAVYRRARLLAPNAAAGSSLDTAAILASAGEVAYQWRIDSDTLTWGANVTAVLPVPDAAAISSGRLFARMLDRDNPQTRFDAIVNSGLRDDGKGVPYRLEYALHQAVEQAAADQPAKLWVEDSGRWFAGADGKPAMAHGIVRVVTERREREERLAYLSRFDGLTGEINRWHLTELLDNALAEAARFRSAFGFMIVAIDNLARINEAYGFDIADETIGAVAKRIRAKMRAVDFLGRFSGNKFGIILKECSSEDMEIAAERFLEGVREEMVQTSTGQVAVTVTIGGVTAPRHARTVPEILARAQEALTGAKAKRLGSFMAYRPSVERDALRRDNVRSTDEIVAALNERRLLVAFEPVVDVATRAPAFWECLMRIRCADGSLLPANAMIPVAERLGLVRLIDHRMIELVVAELVAAPDLVASVNVSPASSTDPAWWDGLGAQLRRHAGAAERLIVEITETTAIHDIDDTRGFVARLKDLGCRTAIDDFGAGYTSFRNLRKLGVDIVKIDGAFIHNLTRSPDDQVFVRALIELARGLGLATVAEWVQDEELAALLAEWGCDFLQGELVGRASIERPFGDLPAVLTGSA